jgi:hypothetical protein
MTRVYVTRRRPEARSHCGCAQARASDRPDSYVRDKGFLASPTWSAYAADDKENKRPRRRANAPGPGTGGHRSHARQA